MVFGVGFEFTFGRERKCVRMISVTRVARTLRGDRAGMQPERTV